MFGWFKAKKVEKVDLGKVCMQLRHRFWEYELVEGRENVIVVKGKYRNHERDFYRLFVHFLGDVVQFKDERGRFITNIPNNVDSKDMYKELKNIMNVL